MERVGAKGLSQKNISKICELIITWTGKLTWALLIAKIEKNMNLKVSRQTLNGYFAIKKEYQLRKQQLRNGEGNFRLGSHLKQSEQDLLEKIESQKRIIEALERQVNQQLDQLKTFVLNVRNIPGVELSELNIRKSR